MKLLIILLCLGAERYLHVGSFLKRFHWIDHYINLMKKLFTDRAVFKAWLGVAIMLLPPLIIVFLVYWICYAHWYGIAGALISFIVLLYCLGPDDLYHQLQSYFAAQDNKDEELEKRYYQEITGVSKSEDHKKATRQLTETIFIAGNERFLGVIFWFIVLGPVGAALYRMSVVLRQKAESGVEPCDLFSSQIIMLQDLLDWIPARLTALLYNVVGNFSGSFYEWLLKFMSGLTESRELLAKSGVAALNLDSIEDENHQALRMIDRVLIVTLVIIALFTIAAWL